MEQRLRLVQGGAGRGDQRGAERVRLQVPGQIVWKDQKGRTQMAAVVTRDISELGVGIECRTTVSIPKYRLVYFQIDRAVRNRPEVPASLRKQSVLSAIFRVGASSDVTGAPVEYGLRLLLEPKPAVAATQQPAWTDAAAGCTKTA